jgi:predicted SprT family Zn-dependent metalloprotease
MTINTRLKILENVLKSSEKSFFCHCREQVIAIRTLTPQEIVSGEDHRYGCKTCGKGIALGVSRNIKTNVITPKWNVIEPR